MALLPKNKKTVKERAKIIRIPPKRDFDGLCFQLEHVDPTMRRWGARDLADYGDEGAAVLCPRLAKESDQTVREAYFDSLATIGGSAVVEGVMPLLRSEDAALRNSAIELFQSLPDAVTPQMEELLTDDDSDVRIFAIDILHDLRHPKGTEWLLAVLERDKHPNVIGTVVDRLAETAPPEAITALREAAVRWGDEPYLTFAIETALAAIGEA